MKNLTLGLLLVSLFTLFGCEEETPNIIIEESPQVEELLKNILSKSWRTDSIDNTEFLHCFYLDSNKHILNYVTNDKPIRIHKESTWSYDALNNSISFNSIKFESNDTTNTYTYTYTYELKSDSLILYNKNESNCVYTESPN